ncbi:hypothetical protein [Ostreiculturibacter nitratireducens]|uniref:hypothetical protein n=1 Tax=Ostreiculturibacter nitratireducens TaxID=3075226 RepID=UPI0031B5EA7A
MKKNSVFSLVSVAAFGAVAALASPGFAQDSSFNLELNTAREVNGGCRLTYVATNNMGVELEAASYEVAVFDKDGAVSRLLILEFGKLPVNKTKVVQFDLAEDSCGNISRLLVNSVAECSTAGGAQEGCMEALATSSRTDIAFGL